MTPDGLKRLQASEVGYDLRRVEVHVYNPVGGSRLSNSGQLPGESAASRASPVTVSAWAFVSNYWTTLSAEVPPTPRYLDLLRSGAEEHGLEASYRAYLARVRPAASNVALGEDYFDTPGRHLGMVFLAGAAAAVVVVCAAAGKRVSSAVSGMG